jgi:LAO/AO transport system kinase
LVSAAITEFRKSFNTVAVIAIDPSSPFSGGALLGDRIRMQEHIADDKVFIRSMSTRGELGGVVANAQDIIKLCAIAAIELVIIETVGVGQSEIAVMHVAPTVVVVVAPGMGDGVQAAKAGVLEIADIVVVNKSDNPAADTTKRDLVAAHLHSGRYPQWSIPILSTVATSTDGVVELCDAVKQHQSFSKH